MMKLWEDLNWRGIVYQSTDPKIAEFLNSQSITAYCGFDPTADSLHVGSLFPILNLVRLQKAGHRPIALVGGATGMIGDPSGKTQERSLLDEEALEKNVNGIRRQLEKFLDFSGSKGAKLVNNADWFKGYSYVNFLRDIGKHFTINTMLARESVRARLEDREHGISYTEFSYMLLQAYDFVHLFEKEGCTLQIGGSDQWGNIVAGTDLIRRLRAKEAYGLTTPLILKSDGSKFGKSEKGNVWLAEDRTSAYEFYQFFMQVDDKDVVRFLKYYTFLTPDEIADLEKTVVTAPEKREAQKALARALTELVHSKEAVTGAEGATQALFGTEIKNLDTKSLRMALSDAPTTVVERSKLGELPLVDLLVTTQLCQSKGAARKDVQSGGIYINNERISDPAVKVGTEHLIGGEVVVLRKGKKTYHLVDFK